jgi:uncharacterized protein YndB with AHSA1/START domain
MPKIEGSAVIARSVQDVFDFVADERNEREYNPRMVRVDKMTPGPIADGTHWSATVESRGRRVDMDIEVTDYTRPSRLVSTTRMSTATIHGVMTFESFPAGTRMRWSWDLRPKGVHRLMGPVIARVGRKQESEIWAGLKRNMEAMAPPTSGR